MPNNHNNNYYYNIIIIIIVAVFIIIKRNKEELIINFFLFQNKYISKAFLLKLFINYKMTAFWCPCCRSIKWGLALIFCQ